MAISSFTCQFNVATANPQIGFTVVPAFLLLGSFRFMLPVAKDVSIKKILVSLNTLGAINVSQSLVLQDYRLRISPLLVNAVLLQNNSGRIIGGNTSLINSDIPSNVLLPFSNDSLDISFCREDLICSGFVISTIEGRTNINVSNFNIQVTITIIY